MKIKTEKGSTVIRDRLVSRFSNVVQSDQEYVLKLCDEVLKSKGRRQHRFPFLRGDGTRAVPLPVDAYYPELNLVIEYHERQHSEQVNFFDKPDKMTVSGVDRGKQRALYDQRRRDLLPQHGIYLVEISYLAFRSHPNKRLVREQADDLKVVRTILHTWL